MTTHITGSELPPETYSSTIKTRSANKSAILAIIMLSYMMIVLDTSVVIAGLPKIRAELGFGDAGLSWVSNAYTLVFGGFLLLGARAGDILGRRRLFIAGLVVFAISSLLIGIASSSAMLIGARAVQGFGAAVLAPSTLALLQTNFAPGPERTRAIAYYASAAGISASIGLVLGGFLADWLSWRVGFFINVPIGIGLIVASLRHIEETELHAGVFDLAGAVTSTLGMSALVFGIVNSAAVGWADSHTNVAVLSGIALLAMFVFIEWRAKQPIMPLRLFASRERSGAYVVRMLFLGANVGFFFFSTQFMQGVLGYSPAQTGLAFLPAMIVNFLAALAAPRMMARFGGRIVMLSSMSMGFIGMVFLANVSAGTGYVTGLAIPMLLIGLGQGGTLGPLTSAGIANVSAKDAGAASGLVNAAHQLGSSLGLGIQISVSVLGAGALTNGALLTHRIGNAMTCAAVMVAMALLIAATTIGRAKAGASRERLSK